jgi:hypothetical protein
MTALILDDIQASITCSSHQSRYDICYCLPSSSEINLFLWTHWPEVWRLSLSLIAPFTLEPKLALLVTSDNLALLLHPDGL